jgi:hypothetical protein
MIDYIALEINENNELTTCDFYYYESPSEFCIKQLSTPTKIKRSKVYAQTEKRIVDTKEFEDEKLHLMVESINFVSLILEFDLDMFTFKTMHQERSLRKEYESNKRRYYQSYEGFFINDDGTLNYQNMIEKIDEIIRSGSYSINKVLDKDYNRRRNLKIKHPESDAYQAIKSRDDNSIVDEWDESEIEFRVVLDEDDLYY